MPNVIMSVSSIILACLFIFIFFLFLTVVLSIFKKDHYKQYEPKLSVVIPCYNEESNIAVCLDGILDSDYNQKKIEIIVVDDGSKDNTVKIVNDYKKKHNNIRLIKAKHRGKPVSLNLGVKKSSYDFVITIDADTQVEKNAIKKIVRPFSNNKVGATNGSCIVKNTNSLISIFQNVEYHYNNLIRKSFSTLFRNGIWFFGAFACYRKTALQRVGYFKKDTPTEDMDIALELFAHDFRIVNVQDALGHTIVPSTLKAFINQRTRWWFGVLQSLAKNRRLFTFKSGPSILFLFINQFWWSFYAVLSFPIIAYQFSYWLPYNLESFFSIFMYTFRWFTLLGPIYVIIKIPEWGISLYSIFGVLAGIVNAVLIIYAIYEFKDRLNLRNLFVVFFYFPYTIILNLIIIISLFYRISGKNTYFKY